MVTKLLYCIKLISKQLKSTRAKSMPRDPPNFKIFDGVNLKLSDLTFFEPPKQLLLTLAVPRLFLRFTDRSAVNDAVEVRIRFKNGGCDGLLLPTLRKSSSSKSSSLQERRYTLISSKFGS